MRLDNESHYIKHLIVGLILVIGACGGDPVDQPGIPVIATTSILGEVVSSLTGAEVEVLIPDGADPHDFTPSAQQVASISRAELVVANGLGLEEGVGDLLAQAASEGIQVLYVAESADPIANQDGKWDPHFWHDPNRMMFAATAIADRLAQIGIDTTPDDYLLQLEALDTEIGELVASIPADRRVLVTNHDSLSYFADRYGFEVVGTVIPGNSSQGSPSSAELAALVETLRQHQVRAIFIEDTASSALAEAVAAEIGEEVEVVELASEALGKAGSYIGMIRSNARAIAEALSQ